MESLQSFEAPQGKKRWEASRAIVRGGIKGIELTFTVPQAAEVIAELVNDYQEDQEVIIGAGTVLDAVTARLAIMAGAEYIVSPTFDRLIQLRFVICIKYLICQAV